MPNGPVISPQTFIFIVVIGTAREVVSYVPLMLPVLPEVLLNEIRMRGTNAAIQYGVMGLSIASETGTLDPRSPINAVKVGYQALATAASPEKAASRGMIAMSCLVLTGASSSDPTLSFAWAGFFGLLCVKMLGLQIVFPTSIGPHYIIIYSVQRVCGFVCREILIEIERKKHGLPRKLPRFNARKEVSKLNPFRRRERDEAKLLILHVLRIKKQKFKIRSRKFWLPIPYNKEVIIQEKELQWWNSSLLKKLQGL